VGWSDVYRGKIKEDEMRIMERETYTEELRNLSSVSILRWSGSEG
jgi:hypothetical protein